MTGAWLTLLWTSLGTAHSAQLAYRPAQECPPESALRSAVTRRLGYDPFHEFSSLRITAVLTREESGFQARVNVRRTDTPPADRTLTSKTCDVLIETLGLALAVAVDPEHLSAAPRVEPDRAPLAPTVQAEPEPSPPITPSWEVAVRAVGGFDLGLQPSGLSSASVGVSVQRQLLRLTLDAFAAPPTQSRLAAGGGVTTLATGASAAVCLSPSWFSACAVGRAGALRYDAQDVPSARSGWTPVVSTGLRAELEWPRENVLSGVLLGEALVPVVRTRLLLGEHELWSPPVVQGRLALGLRVRLW